MNDTQRSRRGLLLGLTGAVIGGFTWVVVAGFIIGHATIWSAGVLAAAIVWWCAWRLSTRQPTNLMLVVGVTGLLICVLDLVLLAWILPQLPTERQSLWLGTNRGAFDAFRPLALIGTVSSAIVTAWALWRQRTGGSRGPV